MSNMVLKKMLPTITDAIRDDLRATIIAGLPLPIPLSLTRLAQHYDVSLTPVRRAVSSLLDERVLLKLGNGRLCVNPAVPKVSNTSGRASRREANPSGQWPRHPWQSV
jgi:DNA-binding GntR family transcriptional regulator